MEITIVFFYYTTLCAWFSYEKKIGMKSSEQGRFDKDNLQTTKSKFGQYEQEKREFFISCKSNFISSIVSPE